MDQRVVLVSVSEGDNADNTQAPERFLGSAAMWVENVCPRANDIQFRLVVDWDKPLAVWADVFIADEFPQGFLLSR
ncbi:hypothetical protein [Paraburkholderia atlantica]|uniref:hypothetical protein n=1 Tax=Paraburkholderia atlantica TaxID=2654982 RepID=UPI0012FEF7F2|nr:hypothetical protein [Paraburkholderia atlantica]